jgi:adenylate cyclase
MFRLFKTRLSKTLLISFIVAAIATMLLSVGFLNTWESKISDAFYSPSTTLDEIVIIAIDDQSLQELGRWPWPRDYFADVINVLNESVVIGIDISFFEPAKGDIQLASAITNSTVVLAIEYTSFSLREGILYGETLLTPTEDIGTINEDYFVGYVNIYTDSDGVTRTFTPHITGVENHDHFALAVVSQYIGTTPQIENERMLINFFSEPGGYTSISFSDVYNKEVDPSYFEGKIVLIGATASDLHDDAIVPISNEAMPGVEINSNIVQSILTRDYLSYQDDISAIAMIFLFAFVTGVLLYRFKIHIASIFLALIAFIYVIISIYSFDSGLILNILFPLLSMITVFIPLVIFYYLTEEQSRKWITSVFGKYVSPVVIDNLIQNPDMIKLGGEKRTITILFSDIRGFTPISEKLSPEELVHLLNDYLTEMTEIIHKDEGLVDKYMGDAIMAFWGAPLTQPNHHEKACISSLDMLGKLRELQSKWKQEGIPSFDIGIGLNSGDAIVGNMGSSQRFDYTAIGDSVNLASRLEGLNKLYGTNIIISEYTYKNVKEKFGIRKLDAVRVKGKRKPIYIYELIARKEELDPKTQECIHHFEEGLDLYFKKKWKNAIESFQKADNLKADPASKLFIDRCTGFISNSPSKDWDGVWEMKTK